MVAPKLLRAHFLVPLFCEKHFVLKESSVNRQEHTLLEIAKTLANYDFKSKGKLNMSYCNNVCSMILLEAEELTGFKIESVKYVENFSTFFLRFERKSVQKSYKQRAPKSFFRRRLQSTIETVKSVFSKVERKRRCKRSSLNQAYGRGVTEGKAKKFAKLCRKHGLVV